MRRDYTEPLSFWQVMEARKLRYAVLEENDFSPDVDYDLIFTQIDKELDDECSSQTKN